MNINEKMCSRCKTIKSREFFGELKNSIDGLRSMCLECRKEIYYSDVEKSRMNKRNDHHKHKEERNAKMAEKYRENPELYKNRSIEYFHRNYHNPEFREKRRLAKNEWRREKREEKRDIFLDSIKGQNTSLEKKCGNCGETKLIFDFSFINSTSRLRRQNCLVCQKELVRLRDNENAKKYYYNKIKKTPEMLAARRLRGRLSQICKYIKQEKVHSGIKTEVLVGCSMPELVEHLKKTMPENLTWDMFMNGELEIDHDKIPCCSVDYNNLEEIKKCFHYTNLKLLHNSDNSRKAHEDKKMSVWKHLWKNNKNDVSR